MASLSCESPIAPTVVVGAASKTESETRSPPAAATTTRANTPGAAKTKLEGSGTTETLFNTTTCGSRSTLLLKSVGVKFCNGTWPNGFE